MSASVAHLLADWLSTGGAGTAQRSQGCLRGSGDWVSLPKGSAVVQEAQKPARDTSEQLGDPLGSLIFCWTSGLLLNGGESEPQVVTPVMNENIRGSIVSLVKVGTDVPVTDSCSLRVHINFLQI